jgi:hypothetical protein
MRRLVLVTRASRTSLRLRGEMVRAIGSSGVRRGDRRYKGLDAVDHCLEANGGEEVEGMLSAGQLDVDDGVGGGVSGSLGEGVCALRGGERVLVTVEDKKRRRAAFGVVERRGRQRPARPRRQPPAELRTAPDRGHAGARLRTRSRLSGTQAGRGQEPTRGAPLPQATARPDRLHDAEERALIDIGATLAQASPPIPAWRIQGGRRRGSSLVRASADHAQESSHLDREELGLLPCGEVAAEVELVPVADICEPLLGFKSRWPL